MLMIRETGWGVYGNSSNYRGNFSINLKLFQNKNIFLKSMVWQQEHPGSQSQRTMIGNCLFGSSPETGNRHGVENRWPIPDRGGVGTAEAWHHAGPFTHDPVSSSLQCVWHCRCDPRDLTECCKARERTQHSTRCLSPTVRGTSLLATVRPQRPRSMLSNNTAR